MNLKLKRIIIFISLMLIMFQDTIVLAFKVNILNSLDEMLIIFFLMLDILNMTKLHKISKSKLIIWGLSVLFSILGIISCYVNSEFVAKRVLISNFLAIKFFLTIITTMDIRLKDDWKEYIIESLEIITKLVMIVAVFNMLLPSVYYKIFTFAIPMKRFGMISVTSLFYHTGKYGWFMLFMALVYYSKYKVSKEKRDFRWMIACGIFSLFSYRTKVIIAMFVIAFVVNVLNKRINLKKIACIAIIFLVLYGAFGKIIMKTYELYYDKTETTSARQSLNENGIKIMKEYFPLGVGFGKYGSWYAKVYYSEYYYKYKMSHIYGLTKDNSNYATDTFWPAIMGETGFLGLCIYVAILAYILYILFRRMKHQNNIGLIYNCIALYALIQSICESFGEPSFNSAPQNIIVAIFIGIALQRSKQESEVSLDTENK